MRADIVAYDRNGQIALIVEVKKKSGTSSEWAAKWRRNIVAHRSLPSAMFFLLALPDRFYLWKNADSQPELILPTFEGDSNIFLQPYIEKAGLVLEQMSGQGFELIVAAWLSDLLHSETLLNKEMLEQSWIVESGLFDTINGGRLDHEVDL